MNKQIRKAIIPAAGLGTRFLANESQVPHQHLGGLNFSRYKLYDR